ncbi:MAG: hypothetical protein MZV63_28615 [Marinilabiliales bacterium]|nr:hypothetical protein [Marinilabiliales bacterium]
MHRLNDKYLSLLSSVDGAYNFGLFPELFVIAAGLLANKSSEVKALYKLAEGILKMDGIGKHAHFYHSLPIISKD